jgi:glycogen debranching enzyme
MRPARRVWVTAQFEAGMHFELHLVPELFCGFAQDPGESPVVYPVACAPQAWSAASVFLLFKPASAWKSAASSGRYISPARSCPVSLDELRIHNLQVAGATIYLLLKRQEHDVGVNVIRRAGYILVMVIK